MCSDNPPVVYNTSQLQYGQPSKINIVENCNGITIKNLGNSILLINDEPLIPLESKSFGGNAGEILFKGARYNINFQVQVVQPLPRIDLAWVTQKFFIDTAKTF